MAGESRAIEESHALMSAEDVKLFAAHQAYNALSEEQKTKFLLKLSADMREQGKQQLRSAHINGLRAVGADETADIYEAYTSSTRNDDELPTMVPYGGPA